MVSVGTSGWSYDHWAGLFYPEDLARSHWFDYYTSRFAAVEVNYSFYRLPSKSTVSSWRHTAPEGFKFALKGSRYITHRLRLRETKEPVKRLCDRARELGAHLAVILWQLRPDMEKDLGLLESFLAQLPEDIDHAVEFRHRSWLTSDVYSLLQEQKTTLVWVSSTQMPPDFNSTAELVYARFHGLEGGFAHDYTPEELRPWVDALKHRDGFAFFNNDGKARAPRNALLLQDLLGQCERSA